MNADWKWRDGNLAAKILAEQFAEVQCDLDLFIKFQTN